MFTPNAVLAAIAEVAPVPPLAIEIGTVTVPNAAISLFSKASAAEFHAKYLSADGSGIVRLEVVEEAASFNDRPTSSSIC